MAEADRDPDFVTNNYTYLNKAVDLEVDRYRKIGDYYSSRRLMYLAVILILICLSVLALVAAYKLFQTPVWDRFTQSVSIADAGSEEAALEQIADSSQADQSGDSLISESFTVFTRSLVETGEYVVTGRTYSPEDLQVPSEQYCYLEHLGMSGAPAAENLAYVSEGNIFYETEDTFLRGLAEENCHFRNTSLR